MIFKVQPKLRTTAQNFKFFIFSLKMKKGRKKKVVAPCGSQTLPGDLTKCSLFVQDVRGGPGHLPFKRLPGVAHTADPWLHLSSQAAV